MFHIHIDNVHVHWHPQIDETALLIWKSGHEAAFMITVSTRNDQVLKFADQAFWNPDIPPTRLRALPVRLPNEDRYILARRASIQSVRGSESGSKVWVHLTDFVAYQHRCQPRTLDNIQEGLRSRGTSSRPPRPWRRCQRARTANGPRALNERSICNWQSYWMSV